MMLRESSRFSQEAVDLQDISQGLSERTEIAQARLLVDFAEAVFARDRSRIEPARAGIREAIGAAAMVDAAAVAAAFHGFTRIADAIGIPYKTASGGQDAPEVRESSGVNRFPRVLDDLAAGR